MILTALLLQKTTLNSKEKEKEKKRKGKKKKKDFVAKFRADTSELVIYFILNKL